MHTKAIGAMHEQIFLPLKAIKLWEKTFPPPPGIEILPYGIDLKYGSIKINADQIFSIFLNKEVVLIRHR